MAAGAKRVMVRAVSLLLLGAIIAAGAFAFLHRQEIADHFEAQRFTPTQEIADLTGRLQLTDAGHRIFFASHPTLDASQLFNEQCAQVDHPEDGHVLGCFSKDRIHLFEVTDERLNGIVEVTAAHELLHAVFSRLSSGERSDLAERLRSLYEELSAEDPALARRMSVYDSLSGMGFANELHSVLGTEVRELPDWLEEHYARWFQDRALIIDLFDGYHAVFVQLRERADELQTQMTELRTSVEARSVTYDAAVQQFNDEWADFVRRNEAYEFSGNPSQFYRLRGEFYDRRDALNAELDSLNADIARYEEMRTELQQLSDLNSELEQNLDSTLAPPATTPNA